MGGVGGGCHGDSNTPVPLPTCLPRPNLFEEGGEEGTVGGRARMFEKEGAGEGEEPGMKVGKETN